MDDDITPYPVTGTVMTDARRKRFGKGGLNKKWK
jgi:hypothetical protein